MEMIYAGTKEKSDNLSLEKLKAYIASDKYPSRTKSYVKLLRTYYQTMKHKARFKSTTSKIGEMVLSWMKHQDWLRTEEAFRQVVGTNYRILSLLGRTHEITVITTIKNFQMPQKSREEQLKSGATMGRVFISTSREEYALMPEKVKKYLTPGTRKIWWDEREKTIEDAITEGGVVWSGDTYTLIKEVREKERKLYQEGKWSYLTDNSKTSKEVLVATYHFAKKFYNLLTYDRKIATTLYRLRSYFLEQREQAFFSWINSLNKLFICGDYQLEKKFPFIEKPPNPKGWLWDGKLHPYSDKVNVKRLIRENEVYDEKVKKKDDAIKARDKLMLWYIREGLKANETWLWEEYRNIEKLFNKK
jgi:hypothetical protein